MAIANVAVVNRRPVQVKTDGTTPVVLTLCADRMYRLKHTGLAEDWSTGAVGAVFFTTAEQGAAPATATAAPTGAEGRGALTIQANNPELAMAIIGPGVDGLALISATGNPVVQIEPVAAATRT